MIGVDSGSYETRQQSQPDWAPAWSANQDLAMAPLCTQEWWHRLRTLSPSSTETGPIRMRRRHNRSGTSLRTAHAASPEPAPGGARGTLNPLDLLPMIEGVSSRRCTLAVGRRDPTKRGLMPFTARLGNRLVTGWLRRQGLAIHDIAPARVCRRLDLLGLKVLDRRFGYPVELLRKAGAAGWDIREFEVSYSARALGTRSKVSGTVRGTVLAAVDFVRVLA